MKTAKVIGVLLLAFAVYTLVGMKLADEGFWTIYNYVTLVFSVVSGVILLKQK